MLFFNRQSQRDTQEDIDRKEVLIDKSKQRFHDRVDVDLEKLEKINKVLGNGITLQIHLASHGGKNGQ